jgi:predicted RNA-binding Zn-ribbon protein involved in translation (DUF1610 family)
MKSSARFFCENCGTEVNRSTGRCPSCGRVFASVRCPACGFTAAESLFKEGCPVCGYCAPKTEEVPAAENAPAWPIRSSKTKPADVREQKKPSGWFSALPAWVYVLAVLVLLAVALALWYRYKGAWEPVALVDFLHKHAKNPDYQAPLGVCKV